MHSPRPYTRWFEDLGMDDVAEVGGKNASLGEMLRTLEGRGIRIPAGFATTAAAYWDFVDANGLREQIRALLSDLRSGARTLHETGRAIRRLFREAEFPPALREAIRTAYRELSRRYDAHDVDVAARSSATAEDLPEASFAGQQESFLNVRGEGELLDACRRCFASLFTDRAIAYRDERGFEHMKVALSVGVQKMVRSDRAGAGVAFTLDTETGFPDVVLINASWGLGESVVKGAVIPDQYVVFKPLLDREHLRPILDKTLGAKETKIVYARGGSRDTKTVDTSRKERESYVLTDAEILQLARWARAIEEQYGRPMDIEWAKDGESGEIFIVQARPETVQSQREAGTITVYELKETGEVLVTGLPIGDGIAAGPTARIDSPAEADRVPDGAVLVTGMTDPDWVPVMKRVAGIVTDHGGRTCHAAIVSRELGIPAIVGTGNATSVLKDGQEVTISCVERDQGHVYDGLLDFEVREERLEDVPETRTRIMMNVASPSAAMRWWRLPVRGVGLARIEFIINNVIRIHPLALLRFDGLEDPTARREVERLTRGYGDRAEYFVDGLARGIATIAASQYPEPVIVRTSDFKSNEYADLIGGRQWEPVEHNPMIGFRGASRYYSESYREGFALECRALKRVREEIGLDNVVVMIPFCRTVDEADRVLEQMAANGLARGEHGLEVYMMCEIPSNVVLADRFAERFDGFSIGSNDLTQLVLGVDRDSAELAHLYDERDEAVRRLVADLMRVAHAAGIKVGICGEAPSDYPEFAAFLVEQGIDSISLNPDSVPKVARRVAEVEAGREGQEKRRKEEKEMRATRTSSRRVRR